MQRVQENSLLSLEVISRAPPLAPQRLHAGEDNKHAEILPIIREGMHLVSNCPAILCDVLSTESLKGFRWQFAWAIPQSTNLSNVVSEVRAQVLPHI